MAFKLAAGLSDKADLELGLRLCRSHRFTGAAGALGPGTTIYI